MVLTETPICDFGQPLPEFTLYDCFGNEVTKDQIKGENGTLVIFMCNHCPYVKAILPRLNPTVEKIQQLGINCIAINSNDPKAYPEDNLENMRKVAKTYAFNFPYCLDETQEVAKRFGAVCTPDFFGYNGSMTLQYRGRFDSSGKQEPDENTKPELLNAMTMIANKGKGPQTQTPSMGCSIKWQEN